jgi:CRISPR-associated endonuclease/helicase Cas3
MIGPHVAAYWGKARRIGTTGPEWHPNAYHCLDVAAAGEALLELRPRYLDALAATSGLPRDLARRWMLLALALHDLGKFADCFQVKWRHIAPSQLGRAPAADPGHGLVGELLWRCDCDLAPAAGAGRFAREISPKGPPFSSGFRDWMWSVFGHHGRPVHNPGTVQLRSLISGDAALDAQAYVHACFELFPPEVDISIEAPRPEAFKRASWLVAGLAIMADWIGSKQDWFPYQPPDWSVRDYWPLAQQRARTAVQLAGLSQPLVAPDFSLADALSLPSTTVAEPTPLQTWVSHSFAPTGQTLVVIEDLTGAGKTEAALLAAHRIMRAGAAEGLYWALPTMATANSLYERLSKSYERLFEKPHDASLVLAHGKREFHGAFQRSVLPAGGTDAPYGDRPDDEAGSAQCAAWIADDRRKAFLADVGVGTLDQALLGVLPAKHQAIRLAALARRVLVCDEIHSYDAYTGRLLQQLLSFHAANGGSAILLTATLAEKLRREVVKAFETGARWRDEEDRRALRETAFPLITVATREGVAEIPCASRRGTRRDLPVERIDSEEAALDLLVASHAEGKAAVWIRNTVHDAIAAYHLARARLGDKVDLFHARFALGDRMAREEATLAKYGKGDKPGRNSVLIATQVVEQALDLDFDIMITDLAPIDLLIQRAGRLHRHERGARPEPVLHVLSPDPVGEASATWFANMFPKGQYVYADHGQLWLTAKHIFSEGGLKLATQSPRLPIEKVFAGDAELPAALEAISGRAMGDAMARRGHAAMNALKLAEGYAHSSGLWASDAVTPTRLGSPQRLLRLAKWDGVSLQPWFHDPDQRIAWRLSEVQVLAARLASVPMRGPLKAAHAELVASWGDMFDPPLVVPLVADGDAWRAKGLDEKGREMAVTYSAATGLEFPAHAGLNR